MVESHAMLHVLEKLFLLRQRCITVLVAHHCNDMKNCDVVEAVNVIEVDGTVKLQLKECLRS